MSRLLGIGAADGSVLDDEVPERMAEDGRGLTVRSALSAPLVRWAVEEIVVFDLFSKEVGPEIAGAAFDSSSVVFRDEIGLATRVRSRPMIELATVRRLDARLRTSASEGELLDESCEDGFVPDDV